MKVNLFIIAVTMFAVQNLQAQTLKGSVVEKGTNSKMSNVFIRDANSKYVTLTDKNGSFEANTEAGHTLIFASPGYISDTLYVTNLRNTRIEMVPMGIALRQVTVLSTRSPNFNPEVEYPDVYSKSKVYALSPTTWFSREGKNARRLKKFFSNEVKERHVDSVFTRAYVGSIVPLKGQELENFMTMYRPSYDFVMSNEGGSLAVYINDSYKKFRALPPEKRKMQLLTAP
ncbi:hypothetical protein ABZR88_18235 [Mucilaginibacter yixingensis]|nr:hypothetical protein [Mucilaginibacter yixingensis]